MSFFQSFDPLISVTNLSNSWIDKSLLGKGILTQIKIVHQTDFAIQQFQRT
ncbi:hypothetical protein HanXRQr2_Chr17g0818681 [Helianthus annuus]|uniref:Uncharacterized protein n=1 Tax=Helianthus annuus TaxID=4232 RepID=A0A9K3DMF7_HELAN|nr:hypothetical protein HanXRQr2_Chr17g0818681 [Helianthus annuus]